MSGGRRGGVAQPQISFKSCVGCLRVSTSCGAFEPSRLDDELLQDRSAETTTPTSTSHLPDITHMMNDTRPSPFFAALPHPG